MRFATVAACLAAAGAAAPAAGQDVVAWTAPSMFSSTIQFACSGRCMRTTRFDDFIRWFTDRDWPLVIVERTVEMTPEQKDLLLPALEDHLARGGRLLLVYTELDSWPELQDLVGVRTTFDVPIIRLREISSVDPSHPTWGERAGDPLTACDICEVFWPDSGDYLDPGAGGYTLAVWDDPASSPAITLTRSGQILTAGFTYDGFVGDGIIDKARAQIDWLLGCPADIDGDGDLTFFDFLAFQNLFAAGDPAADFAFDGTLDFFDFLEFQNQYAVGCP